MAPNQNIWPTQTILENLEGNGLSERHSELRVLRWHERITDILNGEARGPIRANLDLTNLCSHNCFFCEPVEFREQTIADKRHTLDAEVAFDVLEDLKELDCRAITFSGGGEPTLHKEFGKLLLVAKAHGFRTSVITHGGRIDRWTPHLLSGADHIRVSLDSSNDEEHQRMHGSKPGEFGRVVENVRSLIRERASEESPEVGLAYIVADCNSNFQSLVRFREISCALHVDYVQFRPLSEQTQASMTEPWSAIVERINTVMFGVQFEVRVMGQRGGDVFQQRDFDKCYASLSLAVISANGDVTACCDERGIVFGNVNEKRFKDIWLSEEHRKKAFAIAPQLCQRCLMCGYNRGVKKYVVRNEALAELW